jgi:hypothetical protein
VCVLSCYTGGRRTSGSAVASLRDQPLSRRDVVEPQRRGNRAMTHQRPPIANGDDRRAPATRARTNTTSRATGQGEGGSVKSSHTQDPIRAEVTVSPSAPCAETAHLADDRFRLSARQSRRDRFGDVVIVSAPGPGRNRPGRSRNRSAPVPAEPELTICEMSLWGRPCAALSSASSHAGPIRASGSPAVAGPTITAADGGSDPRSVRAPSRGLGRRLRR